MKQVHCLIALLGSLTLAACGGGGGGGGSGGGGPTGATYTIGGTAQGVATYSSSGMVLQDNGGNNLTVASDGAFTFTTPVSSGGAYAVTVATQPTGETCTVTNGAGSASGNVTNVAVNCVSALAGGSNVAAVSVGTFPSDVMLQTFNVPIVTVKVCGTPVTNCANVQVLVDTGSSGLRLMPSTAITNLNLVPEADTRAVGNTLSECAYYADGYAWGGGYPTTQVSIANETASSVPIQVISSSTAPAGCISNSPGGNHDLDTPDTFSADGVLGIGPATHDCGVSCTTSAIYYYTCTNAGACTATTVAAVTDEVTNPVTLFAKDNNGTLLQLPAIGASGIATATGYVAFGVGTDSDNGIGTATILPLSGTQPQDQQPMYLSTSFTAANSDGIIDSGSNAYYFSDSSIHTCPDYTTFYCPAS